MKVARDEGLRIKLSEDPVDAKLIIMSKFCGTLILIILPGSSPKISANIY